MFVYYQVDEMTSVRSQWSPCVVSHVITLTLLMLPDLTSLAADNAPFNATVTESSPLHCPVLIEGPSTHIIYTAGQHLILPCTADGRPTPRYEWYYNDQRLNTSTSSARYLHNSSLGGSLYFKATSRSFEGYYQCRAINIAGAAMSNVSFVQQAVFKDMELSRVVKTLRVSEGGAVVLRCLHFISIPRATVTWYRLNSSLMSTSADHSHQTPVYTTHRMAVTDTGSLVMSSVLRQDEAVYKCDAYNYMTRQSTGGSYYRILLQPALYQTTWRLPQLIYSSQQVTSLAGNDVTLSCFFAAYPSVRIEWSRRDNSTSCWPSDISDYGRRLSIKSVTRAHSGQYVCRASNKVGDATATILLTVDVAPSLTVHLQDTSTTAGGSLTFTCQGQGHPDPRYTWYINAQPIRDNDSRGLGLTCSAHNNHLLLTDIQLVPGFTVTCNSSNIHAYILTTAAVTVLPFHQTTKSSIQHTHEYVSRSVEYSSVELGAARRMDSTRHVTTNTAETNATAIPADFTTEDNYYLVRHQWKTKKIDNEIPNANYLRQEHDVSKLEDDGNVMLLMVLFVVCPLVVCAVVIVIIYRRVTHNRTTYRVDELERHDGHGLSAQQVNDTRLYADHVTASHGSTNTQPVVSTVYNYELHTFTNSHY